LCGWRLEWWLFIISPVIENIDSTATDDTLAVRHFLATRDKTGNSALRFFQKDK